MKVFLLILLAPLSIISLCILFGVNYKYDGKRVNVEVKTYKHN